MNNSTLLKALSVCIVPAVALSATAAKAEISITGSAESKYSTQSMGDVDSTAIGNKVDMSLNYSGALDNGLTTSGFIALHESGVDDSGFTIAGDYGKFSFGGSALAGTYHTDINVTPESAAFDHGKIIDEYLIEYEANGALKAIGSAADPTRAEFIGNGAAAYFTPTFAGTSFAIGVADSDGLMETTFSGQYEYGIANASTVAVKYAHTTRDLLEDYTEEANSIGLTFAMGGMNVILSKNTSETANEMSADQSGIGITYSLTDSLTVSAHKFDSDIEFNPSSTWIIDAEKKNKLLRDIKHNNLSVGAVYEITPGISTSFTMDNGEIHDQKLSQTAVAVNITF